jgi:serine phosphatase RsbU (regulator of sigma subunit)
LDARVEEKGTREFRSLASGINVTVEALQGWIAEAETRMDSELAAARAIQESTLPRTFPPYPDIRKFDVFAIMNAAREVGGDFYDFFLLGDSGPDSGKLAFLIADVSGKGVPAALFMMKAATAVRGELQEGWGLSQAIENVNEELADGNDACMFVTMWVGVLDYETGHVNYVNAGHNPPLLWQEDGGWRWLEEKSGLPLGLITGSFYDTYSVDCRAGDKFLLYTDGVTEAMNKDGELFGEERLEAVANASFEEHPEALVKAVRSDVASFAQDAEQSDDITVLALEVAG